MQDSYSVLMAKSAALALATCLCRNMNLEHLNLFTDSQLLVKCIMVLILLIHRTGGSSLSLN
jgi:hypothetical protein